MMACGRVAGEVCFRAILAAPCQSALRHIRRRAMGVSVRQVQRAAVSLGFRILAGGAKEQARQFVRARCVCVCQHRWLGESATMLIQMYANISTIFATFRHRSAQRMEASSEPSTPEGPL